MIGKYFTSLSGFYSHLNMKDAIDADHMGTQRVWKDFYMRKLGEYQDLHAQRETLMVLDVSKKFLNIGIEIFELVPACFLLHHY